MKSTGIVRKVDSLGRVVLPIDLRKSLDIAVNDPIEILVDGELIVLKKFEPTCTFCSNTQQFTVFNGKNICSDCLDEIQEITTF